MIKKVKNIFNKLDEHTFEILKKSAEATVVKLFGILAGLLISIVMGRTLGADGLGIINLATRITGLVLVVCMFGMDSVLVKNISIGFEKKDYNKIGKNIYTALRFNIPIAIFLSLLGCLLTPWITDRVFSEPLLKWPLIISFIILVPQTLSRIYAAGLTGFRKIWQSSLVNQTLSAGIVLILLLIFIALEYKLTVLNFALILGFASIVVTIVIGLYWKNIFNVSYKKEYNLKPMFKMALPMFLVTSSSVIASNTDVLMLGWFCSSTDIGLYSVAARLAFFISFFLQLSNAAIAPKMASLFATDKKSALILLLKRVSIGLIVLALFVFVIFIIFGEFILNFWGTEFTNAYWLLLILAFGQLVNIATGPCGTLLVMCGKEKIHSKISFLGLFLNIILNLSLINTYGVMGVAIATTITISIENLLKLYYSRKLLYS